MRHGDLNIDLGIPEPDSPLFPNILHGSAVYTVAFFHIHTPTINTGRTARPVQFYFVPPPREETDAKRSNAMKRAMKRTARSIIVLSVFVCACLH